MKKKMSKPLYISLRGGSKDFHVRVIEEDRLVPTVQLRDMDFDDEDFEIFRKHHMSVVTNPASNLKLASGIAPVKRFLDEHINVGIGTDGPIHTLKQGSTERTQIIVRLRVSTGIIVMNSQSYKYRQHGNHAEPDDSFLLQINLS